MDARLSNMMDRDFLIRNLCFLQRLIVASAPLLEFAIDRSQGKLQEYFIDHHAEEFGHDEMLADDLTRLGCEEIPSCHTAASIAGSQYYLIAHESPAMLLGYMKILESQPMPMADVIALEEKHGVHLDSLRHHSLHDGEHAAEIDRQIDRFPNAMQARILKNSELVAIGLNGVAQRLINKIEVV